MAHTTPVWVGGTLRFCRRRARGEACCTVISGWRNLGFTAPGRQANPMAHAHSGFAKRCAFPERDANPRVHIHSGLAKRRFCLPEREANTMGHSHSGLAALGFHIVKVQNQSGLAKPKFCALRAGYEPYGAHSFWVGEA